MDGWALARRRWWLVPLFFVVVAGSLAVNVNRSDHSHPWNVIHPWAVVLAVAAALALFAVDRWPAAVAVNAVLVGGYFAVGGHSGPVLLTVAAGAFLVASTRPLAGWLPAVLASAVVVWAGILVRGARHGDVVVAWWESLGVGALMAAAAALGMALRSASQARSDRRQRTASEERLRMVQELHDGVGHGLAVIAMQSGVALHVLERDPAAVREALEAIRSTSREALESLRDELSRFTGDPAPRTPQAGLADLDKLVERVRAAGVDVRVDRRLSRPLNDEVEAAVFAIVQESLTNVLRHAAARSATVSLDANQTRLVVAVTDDGRGAAEPEQGFGISGMRARAEALGGQLTAGAGPGGGFRVLGSIPLEEQA